MNELGDEVPLPGADLASPEHLDHVRVADLPQGAESAPLGDQPAGIPAQTAVQQAAGGARRNRKRGARIQLVGPHLTWP
jgi:hypothetical protein